MKNLDAGKPVGCLPRFTTAWEVYWNFLLVFRIVRYRFVYHHDDFPGTGKFTGSGSVKLNAPKSHLQGMS